MDGAAYCAPPEPIYHVLLVGIDAYPPGYKSLSGCVNDIDAIEQLLLDPPGIGIPPEQVRVTRLAAARPNRPSRSRFQAHTLPPTRANLVQALQSLAGPQVQPTDRVLIYYSGHGKETTWPGSRVWHEALTPHDGQQMDFLYDIELNALINAIAARTQDLTIVLDCCHSGGVTRELAEAPEAAEAGAAAEGGAAAPGRATGADRTLGEAFIPGRPPDPALLGAGADDGAAAHMLQGLDPHYLAVVACLSDEKAGEGVYPGEARPLGILTYCLVQLLAGLDAAQRRALRWGDLWPQLLAGVGQRCTQLGRRAQVPWIIGRQERHVFGGSWEPQDVGYPVTRLPDGRYRIGAGSLMGLTQAAEVAVYGPTPLRFPELGSAQDQPLGCLQVVEAERAVCTAIAAGSAAFSLPPGARGRLVKPGESERLRVALNPYDAALAQALGQSPLLALAGPLEAEAEVTALPGGGWTIGNEVEAVVARVPPEETDALRAGLETCFRYQAPLRMARSCNDAQLNRSLSLRLLDCSDPAALAALPAEALADPPLPEAGRDGQGIYALPAQSRVCFQVTNDAHYTLQVTLLNCSASGLVEYVGAATIKSGAGQVFWFRDEPGRGFPATPGKLPPLPGQSSPRPFVTDRLIAIGTTRRGVDLSYLRVEQKIQQVVDAVVAQRGLEREMTSETEPLPNAPVELWTATITPVRIAT